MHQLNFWRRWREKYLNKNSSLLFSIFVNGYFRREGACSKHGKNFTPINSKGASGKRIIVYQVFSQSENNIFSKNKKVKMCFTFSPKSKWIERLYIYIEREREGETIKLSSKRKQHYSFILKPLLKKSIQVTWLCRRPDIYSMYPPSASITASIRIRNWEHAFSTSAGGRSANTRRMAAIRLALVLWEVMLVIFSTYD